METPSEFEFTIETVANQSHKLTVGSTKFYLIKTQKDQGVLAIEYKSSKGDDLHIFLDEDYIQGTSETAYFAIGSPQKYLLGSCKEVVDFI